MAFYGGEDLFDYFEVSAEFLLVCEVPEEVRDQCGQQFVTEGLRLFIRTSMSRSFEIPSKIVQIIWLISLSFSCFRILIRACIICSDNSFLSK